MDILSILLDLDEEVDRLSRGINAVQAICAAIEEERSGYAPGLYAVWELLRDAEEGARRGLDGCLEQLRRDGEGKLTA